jgi:hypothetical protein
MWPTENQHVLWKACKTLDKFFSLFSWIFLAILTRPNRPLGEFGSPPNGVDKLHKKFQNFWTNERKVMPVLPKVCLVMVIGRQTRRRQLGQSVPKLQHRSQDQSSLWLIARGIRQMM